MTTRRLLATLTALATVPVTLALLAGPALAVDPSGGAAGTADQGPILWRFGIFAAVIGIVTLAAASAAIATRPKR